MPTKKKVSKVDVVSEAGNIPVPAEPIKEVAKVDPYVEIHEMTAAVDKFYAELESKKRLSIQPDFLSISNFDNRSQSGKHFKMHLDFWRKYLEE
jgi:hypoxanthine-guanine phosphoribosyltransferase